MSYNHEVTDTPVGKVELFKKYFCSVFLPTTYVLDNNGFFTNSSITDMEISQLEVSVGEVMERLSPDKIPVLLLKECSVQIAPILCSLFNYPLNIDQIPCEWKSADVTPLQRIDFKEAAENNRLISLLPIVSKVLEDCAGNRFYKHLKDLISVLRMDSCQIVLV